MIVSIMLSVVCFILSCMMFVQIKEVSCMEKIILILVGLFCASAGCVILGDALGFWNLI